jgi:cytochrome P450 family 4
MALLDVLLKSTIDGKPLTNEEIQEEVDTFTFEGHETVTTTISFVLYLLSHHPEIQQKVYEEIQAETGKSLTYNSLQSLKYTESVIKETLRLFPPVPIYSRRIEEDLEIDGRVIPANSNLNLLAYVIHKDPRYFPEPEKFIPERFDDLKYTVENQYVFVPFSAGPRNCIGEFCSSIKSTEIFKTPSNFQDKNSQCWR